MGAFPQGHAPMKGKLGHWRTLNAELPDNVKVPATSTRRLACTS